jgi:hypothetical protein
MPRVELVFSGDMEGKKLVNLGDGTDAGDGVSKGQLDAGLVGKVSQAQLDGGLATKLNLAEKGQPNGVATLDANGKVPAAQLDIAATIDGDMAGARLINLGDGTAATDAVNKGQLDATLSTKLGAAEKGQANGIATLDAGGKVPTTQIPSLAYVPTSQKGQANGVAGLDAGAKVPTAQIPSLAYVPTSEKGQANGVATLDASGKVPASQLSAQQSGFAHRLSAAGSVNLNTTAEQAIDIAHGSAAKPPFAKVIALDVIQDNLAINTSALRWAAGYPVYDEAASTNTNARVLVKFSTAAGVAATGRARIFFEL